MNVSTCRPTVPLSQARWFSALLATVVTSVVAPPLLAASCCGGGSAGALVLPKYARAMVALGIDAEHYDGLWNGDGEWVADPVGSDLNQYRLNVGLAHRLAPRWQLSANLPYVWNRNRYAQLTRNTEDLGDGALGLWYESFDNVTCVWNVNSWADLMPSIYWGMVLTVPTGVSPYDAVGDNFDITGRGFYRLDGSLLIDKTVYPWNAALQLTYGRHIERPINREYGNYVEPYTKQLGDRFSGSLAFGYTYFTDTMQSITTTLAYAYLWEDQATIDGHIDTTSGLEKRSLAATVAWSSEDRNWVAKVTWSHAPRADHWGRNFPATDVISMGVNHVLR